MFDLTAQVATLNQDGKQVGGLFDCEIRVILQYTTVDGMKEYKPVKKIVALSYWLLEPIQSNEFDAEFFAVNSNQLVSIDAGRVVIDFPDLRTLDRRLYAPIEVRWVGCEY
uniref:Uncharacterized protein n=1 Tax=viral metagenome TaxID=1070528 RepID=A0A6M3L8B7_9ZZZZ